ncbi:MAG: triose-phosphate isomerase [Christensenellaceae bacterium]|jgi:triosephosphate isomerase|nr:triose-phosphate isomerase [Christensenellaceae bacterium]
MRKPIIAGNWKMNLTPSEAKALITELIPLAANAACDVVVCPPFVDLALAVELTRGTSIGVGAQNIHWAPKGAFTGEISASMLKEIGVGYAIIGHSERRQYFGETDATVNSRAKAAIEAGITPIICVGESLAQREGNETEAIVSGQVKAALEGIPAQAVAALVIAYEPIWAIGTGKTATDEQANETVGTIRATVAQLYGQATADALRIQYGGSMNPKNVKGLMAQSEIDGGLIGGASLSAADFAQVIHY